MGTYRWMQYFKRGGGGRPYVLIGLEVDWPRPEQWPAVLPILRLLASRRFAPKIALDARNVKGLKKYVRSGTDQAIYDGMRCMYQERVGVRNRYEVWQHNIARAIRRGGRLYINGYHLDRRELRLPIRTLHVGVASAVVYRPIIALPREWLRRQGISVKAALAQAPAFYVALATSAAARALAELAAAVRVRPAEPICPPTPLERRWARGRGAGRTGWHLLDTRGATGAVRKFGGRPVYTVRGAPPRRTPHPHDTGRLAAQSHVGTIKATDYDYIVFMPKSEFRVMPPFWGHGY
jgi:hypothetical protein